MKISNYKIKAPKYQQSLPIETWLRNMEIFGRCSEVKDERLITVAIANLLSGDAGANVVESLDGDEMTDWKLFKEKLINILGHTREFYKHEFHSYQRGADSFGLCMANLKAYFKKGYNRQSIGLADEEMILERFISCQNQRLKELLSREKSSLNINTIAQRAHELQRSIPKAESLFTADASSVGKQQSEIAELCTLLKTHFKSNSSLQEKRPAQSKNSSSSRKRLDIKRLEGHCLNFVRRQTCRHGESCKYLHATSPPKTVVDYVKSLSE